MTHDELLATIDFELEAAEFEDACGDGGHPPTHKALRAVVELHRNVDGACWECQDSIYHEYPCPTIRAIEKELK